MDFVAEDTLWFLSPVTELDHLARGDVHDLIGWEARRNGHAARYGRTAGTLDVMSQLVRMLLGEKVVIGSPLPPGVARDRLRAAKAAFDEDGYRIAGRIAERRITVSIRRASIRSSWIQILRGRLENAPHATH